MVLRVRGSTGSLGRLTLQRDCGVSLPGAPSFAFFAKGGIRYSSSSPSTQFES
jgi:hypothetical protein